ncbi:MAG TPA: hypothetical protein VIL46_10120 [Gemmataceae bacterium]
MRATLRDYLYAGIYTRPCRFANIERFISAVGACAELDAATTAAGAQERLRDAAAALQPAGLVTDDAGAQRRLVAEDLRRIAAALGEVGPLAGVEERLPASGRAAQARLSQLGLEVGDVPLRIVDAFPEPFTRFAWSAFAPDREDEQQFGIERGVYFRRDLLRPLYSEALFAHEVIHTLTGRVDPEVYAMGLEEGIAEVIGTCYASLAVLPWTAVRNVLIYGRHGAARARLWSVYLDHTRQAFLLFREFGLVGLAELVRRGRAAIHHAEALLLAGRYRDLALPRGGYDQQTASLLEFACCGYLPSHVLSPLECLLLREVAAGLPFDEVCRRAGVDPHAGRPVLEGLGTRSALFVPVGSTVGYSNAERYRAAEQEAGIPIIRYLPTEHEERP